MTAAIQDIRARLDAFDARNAPTGLFLRYSHGRVSHFWARQVMTLLGSVALVLLAGPFIGLMAGTLALAGEIVDCGLLRAVPGLVARGAEPARLSRLATVSAGLQAATISACIALAWLGVPDDTATAFAMAFAAGAAVNAGLVLPFHRSAALVRLALYAATLAGLFLFEIVTQGRLSQRALFDLIATGIMGYAIYIFLGFVVSGHRRHTRDSRDLLVQSLDLARANSHLKEQQREARNLSLVARHANDSVIMAEPDGCIFWVNEAFTRITGYSLQEARGLRPSELLNAPDTDSAVSDGIAAAVAAGRAHRAEILNQRKDGGRIWIETNIVPVLDETGAVEMVISIERDISSAKKHEAELAEAKIAAEKGERAKASFLATMSHEIRTPMNGIIGMADLLAETQLGAESRHYVQTIRQSANALLRIINDILEFSRLDAGKPVLHANVFSPAACIGEALAILKPQARARGLTFDLLIDGALPDRVTGDDGRLRQILINIVGNAIKFTSRGGVTIRASARGEGTGYRLRFEIEDTGIGIAPDRIAHVFDEFEQADTATTRQFGGTGLGLSISRLLAREMGGDITLTSALGKGSCFTVTLHMARGPDATHPAPALPDRPPDLAHRVVLVAEDNRTNRLLVRKFLKDTPFTLLFAENGRAAVEMTRRHRPDIVLMDMSMPEMDGLAATRAIRAEAPAQPHIIALTANAFASDRAACLAAGMNGFLSKPLHKDDLLQTLAQSPAAAPFPFPPPADLS
ncbi:PAS domain-containing hybrid sensor histidine kinase/response regulator [Aquicoccus sp.]|uniref:PAS domain-containing hybrid sensor histidine kinase/response regulator n=1 Tax=Aquicoccus sp. TaxID=2055851 RepID=UPI003563628F